jgi:cell division protein FtsL
MSFSLDLYKKANSFILQDRSEYQIEKFVVGQHDTLEMQYRQILIEAQDLIYKIKLAEIAQKKLEMKIKDFISEGTEESLLDAEEAQLTYAFSANVIEGSRRELEVLERLYKKFPQFTEEEIEANQQEYWNLRLHRQAELDRTHQASGITPGNLQALVEIGELAVERQLEK